MQKDVSPEEKLLSIIKGKRNKPDDAGSFGHGAADGKTAAVKPGKKIDDYILTILKSDFFKSSVFDPRSLKLFNRYVIAFIVLISAYLLLDTILVNPSRDADLVISKITSSKGLASLTRNVPPVEMNAYSHYSNSITGKKIFSEAQVETQNPAGDLSSDSVGLVGIMPGAEPQAIVEDKKNQKTYYLTKGQTVDGITVEEISEDKVLLDYKGKKINLLL